MNKKKILIIGIVIVLVILICSIIIIFSIKDKKKESKETITNSLEEIGRKYYEETYYVGLGDDVDAVSIFLSRYEDTGLPVNLENLERTGNGQYKDDIEDLLDEEDMNCSKTKTQIVIYPESPYGKKDYRIKVELDCEKK